VVKRRTGRFYLDASALVKLVITEAESSALHGYLGGSSGIFSSRIGEVEVRRVVGRQREVDAHDRVESLMRRIELLELDADVARRAAALGPVTLRSLDAIHLASALAIAPELDAVIVYDVRLADAARLAGLPVVAPE
jgi:predicted nucleic acid-binding protein